MEVTELWIDKEQLNTIVPESDSYYLLTKHGDVLSQEDREKVNSYIASHDDGGIFLLPKLYEPSRKSKKGIMYAPFSYMAEKVSGVVDSQEVVYLHSFFPEGIIIRGSVLVELTGKLKKGYTGVENDANGTELCLLNINDTDKWQWLFDIQAKAAVQGKLHYIADVKYILVNSYEGDKTFCEKVYDREWYYHTVNELTAYMLQKEDNDYKEEQVSIEKLVSLIVMYHAVFIVKFMLAANLDNVNKHLIEGSAAEAFLYKLGDVLAFVSDSVICDSLGYQIDMKNRDCLTWVLLILKYKNDKLEYNFKVDRTGLDSSVEGELYFEDTYVNKISQATADIQFMDYEEQENGIILTIEGRVSPILLMNGAEFGVMVDNVFIPAVYNERYAHTKAFGISIFKLRAFTLKVELPYDKAHGINVEFVTRYNNNGKMVNLPATLEFDSHFSRLCDRFRHSYWKINKRLMMYVPENKHNIMRVVPANMWKVACRELALWKDMLATKQKKIIKFIIVRALIKAKPIIKHKPIWLFFDKIYKAGDSAEYLYRYSLKQKDGIKKYYLADGNSEDYARMEAEGLKPVKRRSLKHRYAFLYADMVVVSNSTVYAFNDFGTVNSCLIRDLMNFHVVCVQHGMSIQKIAVAQNRLRDNTRLYFCASKYEIENLSKPIYDYQGYDALKLTGVPRYDGLVNEDKRQILLSPTWRMQAAVPVTKNEGVSRDYNPLFKETDYYRIYNSLINDKRLIEAAKTYNYRLLYVLHPIVSPQIDDFDTNEYVDIIPAVKVKDHKGVNYEKAFRESSLMVTDFSGVQFDFAYMRKPVVYLHHRDIPKHYEEGTFFYDTMGFGEICQDNDELIDTLISYMKNNCTMKPEYRRRADDFFAYSDHNNCQRIYDLMLDYQKNKIK
jgi:CDP-glycerol glycerophosphotransferase (TagB/SpsB family)